MEIEALARETSDGGPAMLIGTPWVDDWQALQRLRRCSTKAASRDRLQGELARITACRREARVRARTRCRAGDDPRRARRIPICEDTWMEESAEYENVVDVFTRPAPKF